MPSPIFTYSANVPQSSQYIRATQQPILNNFQAISEFVNVNHVGFTNSTDYGKHNFTSFPFQVTDPNTGPVEMAIYCKETPGGTNAAEIFYRYPNNGDVIQLTNNNSLSNYSLLAQNGYAILTDSNVGIIWGRADGLNVGGTSQNDVTLPAGISTSNAYGLYTPIGSFSSSQLMYLMTGSASGTTFRLTQNTSGSQVNGPSVYWMFIGSIQLP